MAEEKVDWPVDVRPFFDEARQIVLRVVREKKVRVFSAILDDWNSGVNRDGKKIRGPRIIWGALRAVRCWHGLACEDCPMFEAVGADVARQIEPCEDIIRTALCEAPEEYLRILPTRQRFLNCKLFYHYVDAFIAYFLSDYCVSPDVIEAEVVWVKRFRLLYLEDMDLNELAEMEASLKKEIFNEVVEKLRKRGEFDRARVVLEFVEKNHG